MIEKSIMEDFLFRVHNDETLSIVHKPCRLTMSQSNGITLNPINLAEACEAAETHLLNLCPGSHSNE